MALWAYVVLGLLFVAAVVLFVVRSRSDTFKRLFRHYRPLDMVGVAVLALVGIWGLAGYIFAIPGFPIVLVPAVLTATAVVLYLQRIVADSRDSVTFGPPIRIDHRVDIFVLGEEQPRAGRGFLYRLAIKSRRTQDDISFEVHVAPAIGRVETVHPPLLFERKLTYPYMLGAFDTATLRHGQEVFVDLVSVEQTENGWSCRLLQALRTGSGTNYRGGPLFETGRYELTLKVFFSDRRNDERRYTVDVDTAEGILNLKPLWP